MRKTTPAHYNAEKKHFFKKGTAANKLVIFGLKKAHALTTVIPGLKLVWTLSNGLSKYYAGDSAGVAATRAAVELGIYIIFPPISTVSVVASAVNIAGFEDVAEIIKYPLNCFTECVANALIPRTSDEFVLLDFMAAQTALLAEQTKFMPIQNAFNERLAELTAAHQWTPELSNQFNLLFAAHLLPHLIHDEVGHGFRIALNTAAVHVPSSFNQETINNAITHIGNQAIHDFEQALPTILGVHFNGVLPQNNTADNFSFTEERLQLLMKVSAAKIEEMNRSSHFALTEISRSELHDIASIIQTGAMVAVVLEKPALAKSLGLIGSNIERAISSIEKISANSGLLSNIAGALTGFASIAGIISGAIALFSDSEEESVFQQLGRQLTQVGKQLDGVLQNQQRMMDFMGVMSRQIAAMDQRLINFIRTSNTQFDFLKIKELTAACAKMSRHRDKTSVIPLTDSELRSTLLELEIWLRDHLSSKVMNGAIYANISAEESIGVLTAMMQDEALFLNNIGFLLERLQLQGIAIPAEFFQLPPMMLYENTADLFTYGVATLKLQSANDGACEFTAEIQAKFSLLESVFNFLEKEVWRQLLALYSSNLNIFLKTLSKNIRPTDICDESISLENFIGKLSLSSQKEIYNAIDGLEEIRLLFNIMEKLTDQYLPSKFVFFSKQAFLQAKILSLLNKIHHSTIFLLSWKNMDLLERSLIGDPSIANQFPHNFATFNLLNNPSLPFMYALFSNKMYELLILHFAMGVGNSYTCPQAVGYRQLFPVACSNILMSGAQTEYNSLVPDKKANTNFLVLITLFSVDKLMALRFSYQYYVACVNGNGAVSEKLRPSIDPKILLWLTAILGRYDIFLSLGFNRLSMFDFVENIGTKTIGTYSPALVDADKQRYTVELHRPYLPAQSLTKKETYTSPTTALMVAAKCNRSDVVQGMLEAHLRHGKDIGLQRKDADGLTPAEIAYEYKHYALAKLLDEHSHTLSAEQREIIKSADESVSSTRDDICHFFTLGHKYSQRLVDVNRHAETNILHTMR